MKRKIISALLVFVLSLFALASCDGFFGGGTQQGGENNEEKIPYNRIVHCDYTIDFTDFRSGMADLVGPLVSTVYYTEAPINGEIVFGEADRAITVKAKAELTKAIEASSQYNSGYIIYAEGDNVAVYYSNYDMATIAVASALDKCIKELSLKLPEGVIFTKLYDYATFQREKHWLALEAVADPDVVASFRKLHAYYDGPMIAGWLANLWDPVNGGFYYSISARDNPGFLPDLESTEQLIRYFENNGAFDDRDDVFPDYLKKQIVEFARKMQSHENGYFFHPQWVQDKGQLATDRFGRDQGWATSIITSFTYDDDGDGIPDKQYPRYCALNGTKCEEHETNGGTCSFASEMSLKLSDTLSRESAVTVTLTSAKASAVSTLKRSNVIAAEVSKYPDYSSRSAFSAWLEEYNATIKEDSGRAHNLAAMKSEIARYGYTDIVISHLDRVQAEVFAEMEAQRETPTGLWQRNIDYKAVWGLLKYMSFYGTTYKIDIKYVPYIVDTCIKVIQLPPDGDYASNDLYNQWSGISQLISNVRKFYGDSGVQVIYQKMRANTASLIDNCIEKIKPFKREDGSFSSSSSGMTSSKIYGTAIAMGVVEGNVNSTGLISSMYRCMFSCIGYPVVPLLSLDDGEMFIETVQSLPPIDKIEIYNGTMDFEKGIPNGSLKFVQNNQDAFYDVVDDPIGENGTSFFFYSPIGTSSGDSVRFSASGVGENCFIFESDFYVDSKSADKTIIFQVKLMSANDVNKSACMLAFKRNGDNIEIYESPTTSTSKYNQLIATAKVGEWFTVRVEYYANNEDNEIETPVMKYFINNEYVRSSNMFYGSHNAGATPNNVYYYAAISSLKSPELYLYMDNCFFSKENKMYDPDDETIWDSRNK